LNASDDERIAYLSGEGVTSLSSEERAELDQLRSLLEAPATWAEPDQDLEDRVVAAIGREAGAARQAGAGVSDVAAAVPRRAQRGGSRFGAVLGRFRRPQWALGLAAAAAAVVVAVAIAVSASNSPAPLHFAMVVSGTPLAPNAHGSAKLTKTASGWRIELSATGLPHLENGRFYQAWLKNAAGVLVPVGTFNDARRVTLWSGVPVTEYRTLTVTQQLANGNPASSGRRVLVGTIR
jgi:hypothetical protein